MWSKCFTALDPLAPLDTFNPALDCQDSPADPRCADLTARCIDAVNRGVAMPDGCDVLTTLCRSQPSLAFCRAVGCEIGPGAGGQVNPRLSLKPQRIKQRKRPGKKALRNKRTVRYKAKASFSITNSKRVLALCGVSTQVSFDENRSANLRTGAIKRKN